MNTNHTADPTASALFQSAFGTFQPRYLWLFPLLGIIGVVGTPAGRLFWNEGWEIGNHPIEPWSATMMIEIFSVGALMIVASLGLAALVRRKSPQRVAVTDSALIVPKGMFSSVELVLPLAEIDTTVFNAGFVKQLQVKHNRRKILVSSALFPSDADFERLISNLPR